MSFSDKDIKTIIVNRLNWDARVDASKVLVEVDQGMVTLTGTVSTYGERQEACQTAGDVGGVRAVDNQLTVLYPSNITLPSDEEVEKAAKRVLAWSPNIDETKIEIKADSGVITLKGSVTHYWQRLKVHNLISELIGVREIKNELSVVPTNKVMDELIAKAIMHELERSDLLQAQQVEIKVADGIVTLSGTVNSYPAEKRAFEAALHTLGVVEIVNDLNVAIKPPLIGS